MRSTTPISLSLLLATGVLLSACASAPERPDDTLSMAQYALSQAHQKVSADTQSAPLYEAEKRLGQARSLANKPDAVQFDYIKARRLAQEATLDAQLAQAQAEAQQAQAQKAELQKSLETLQGEEAE